MKTRLSLFCLAIALIAAPAADAQLARPLIGGGFARSAFQSVAGDLHRPSSGTPGRLWFEANVADQGLGYSGGYLTVGAKTRLFEDRLDGRWLFEGQFNHSLEEDGGAFANIGVERVFSIDSAGADIAVGLWYDYDGDEQGNFAHTFHQVGVSGSIKTRRWDLIGNAYMPTGIQDYSVGLDGNCFFGNSIALTPGIDSALQGFDVTLRLRPKQLAFFNGTVDLGGYHYNSDIVDAFGGGRVRMGMQIFNGLLVNLEVNHDERFDTTGVLGLGWVFGANASGYGHEYSGIGRDLEQTVRNDHIVRFNQDFVLAVDPDTGLAYNVVHVNNNADPAFADGSAETPYNTLLAAQNNSAVNDIIFVDAGDGTDRNMDRGIRLQDGQQLLGSGQSFLLPVQGGVSFQLCNEEGLSPTVSNSGGFAVVQLANDNVVSGINIDATGARFGIFGEGTNGSIRDNTVANASEDGMRLNGVNGSWDVSGNTFQNNGQNGLYVLNSLDTSSTFNFEDNIATGNAGNGIELRNFDPASVQITNNTTSNNLGNGLLVDNFPNSSGNGLQIMSHTSIGNAENGMYLANGSGNLSVLNSIVQNNTASGILVENWATLSTERILVGTTEGGVSTLSGNGALANLQFVYNTPGIQANAVVTGLSLSDGVRGLGATVEGFTPAGIQSTLNLSVIDNLEISRNLNDGIRLVAINSGILNAVIRNSGELNSALTNTPLQILDNASANGDGIAILADGLNGQPAAQINAIIENVAISNAFAPLNVGTLGARTDGIGIDGINNSVVNINIDNITIGEPATALNRSTPFGIRAQFDNDGSQLINRLFIDNSTIFADNPLFVQTFDRTYSDISLANSNLLPEGIQSIAGLRADNTSFGDDQGFTGVYVQAIGLGDITGRFNALDPNGQETDAVLLAFYGDRGVGFSEVVSDGDIDNLTRVSLVNNTIQDMTFEGVELNTRGDAHMLVEMTGNRIQNNGAGFNNDTNDDDRFNNQVADGFNPGDAADPNNLTFFDGVDINAFDQSVISARLNVNTFVDNFERGLSLNTYNSATINAVLGNNTFFGNDRGNDPDVNVPVLGTGNQSGTQPNIITFGEDSIELVNNEEYYRRDFEFQILINPITGAPIDLAGANLPADTPGIFIPGNTGFDIFGNAVAQGTANMNVSMSNNALQLDADILDFSVAPGDFQLGLDGLTNGFTGPFFGVTDAPAAIAFPLVGNEETFFGAEGF